MFLKPAFGAEVNTNIEDITISCPSYIFEHEKKIEVCLDKPGYAELDDNDLFSTDWIFKTFRYEWTSSNPKVLKFDYVEYDKKETDCLRIPYKVLDRKAIFVIKKCGSATIT